MSGENNGLSNWRYEKRGDQNGSWSVFADGKDVAGNHMEIVLGDWLTKDCAKLIAAAPALLEALKAAQEHLEYCGYGDSYERECAISAKLPEQIDAALALAKPDQEGGK